MFFQNVLLAALSASSVFVGVNGRRLFGCGTDDPSAEHIELSMVLAAEEAYEHALNLTQRSATITVNVYFHIIASSGSIANGNLSDNMIKNQLAGLNKDFEPHAIEFKHAGTDRHINSDWARDADEFSMKRSLRKGTYKDLNIYFQPRLARGALGYATLPMGRSEEGSSNFIRDGVSLDSQTVPGGSRARFNKGKTGTHEVGHWMGLYHTFQGGCTGHGDFVADTPAQASASSGCPRGRNSCPDQPGVDPIHNYMDYSDDDCYEEFTVGQRTRMHSFWNAFRAPRG